MKWSSHIRMTLSIGRKLGIQNLEDIHSGVLLPDKVGTMDKYLLLGADISFPHHFSNDEKIKNLLYNIRKDKLTYNKVDHLAVGALCHLIQDSEALPSRNPQHLQYSEQIDYIKLPLRYDHIHFGSPDGWLLDKDKIRWISGKSGSTPEESVFYSYMKTEQVLRSILQPRKLPKDKDYIKSYKIISKSYFKRKAQSLLTYLNPLGVVNAIIDRKALFQKDLVKKYTITKKNAPKKVITSILGCLIFLGLFNYTDMIPRIDIPYFLELISFIFFLPILGQILVYSFPLGEEMQRKADWYIFPNEK